MIRSLLFAPANRPELLANFTRVPADCCVIDLEDATPEHEKANARNNLNDVVDRLRRAGMTSMLAVRVNVPHSPHYLADLEAAFACDIDAVVLPKLEDVTQTRIATDYIQQGAKRRRTPQTVIGGIESVKGVLNSVAICAQTPKLGAVYFGAEDFIADIGGRRTPLGQEVAAARAWVVMAAHAAGIVAIDQAVLDVLNDGLYRADAGQGRDMGYQGKICLAPTQVSLANAAFSPSDDERAYAKRLITAYEQAMSRGIGTIAFEGKLVDGPLLKRALAVLGSSSENRA